MFSSNNYHDNVAAGATKRDQWLVCYNFTNLCQRFAEKLLHLDSQLTHPASVAFVQVLDFLCRVPFAGSPFDETIPPDVPASEDAAAKDAKDYGHEVPVYLLQSVVARLMKAAESRGAKSVLPELYKPWTKIPSWNPLQCYLQVVMDCHFAKNLLMPGEQDCPSGKTNKKDPNLGLTLPAELTDLEKLKPLLRSYLQENETAKPEWYGVGMPSCLFLYQVPFGVSLGKIPKTRRGTSPKERSC
jgi:hypothetical protein